MSTYVKDNALNTALQLLQIIASGRSFSDRLMSAQADLHISMDYNRLLQSNAGLIDLLKKIEAEAAASLEGDKELLSSYIPKIVTDGKEYESMVPFLFLTEDPSEQLTAPDFASYEKFLMQLTEEKRCELFLKMLQRYNHFYLRASETEDDNPAALPHSASSMDIVSSIMELEVPLEIRWRILDIFTHWDTHITRVLPLLKKTYDTLLSYADALEPYAQAFLSYWHPHIEELGGFCTFAESLFPVGSIPENPLGYKLCISFFLPYELGLSVDLVALPQLPARPHQLTMGILYGKDLIPQNPYAISSANEDETCFNALKQLGDKRRFEILSYLSNKPAYASELVKHSGLTAATISHHMSQLAEASLIRLEKIDTKVYYSLNAEMVEKCLDYCRRKLLHRE